VTSRRAAYIAIAKMQQIKTIKSYSSECSCIPLLIFPSQTQLTGNVTTPQPFYGLFSGTTRVSRCQKRTSGFMVQGKIKKGRHTDHPVGHPFELTSAHLHHPPIFLQAGCPSCHPTNSVKALKAMLLVTKRHLLRGVFKKFVE